MIRIENTDELLELISQELKEFINIYNPNIFVHKKLYNLLLKVDHQVHFKMYSVYTDRYQIILLSILDFICQSLPNFELDIYIDDGNLTEEFQFSLYWLESDQNYTLLQLDTDELDIDYDTFVEEIQLLILDAIKENTSY
ncbi:MAG: hypothetical protein HKN92_03865 [Chitinophagales bacterium]|nr:hypothetical protein [Chitinophagales bacterium]